MNPGLPELLADIRKVRVALVGDFALDAYWFIDMARSTKSLETGKPVRPVRKQVYQPGAAGNIAENLLVLGARVYALGVVGRDPWGSELTGQLKMSGADVSGMIVQEKKWSTPVFVKPIIGGRESNRYDTADYNRISRESIRRLFRALSKIISKVDVVVVNQQIPNSLHNAEFRRRMSAWMRRNKKILVIADTRDYGDIYRMAAMKLNEHEAVRMVSGRARKEISRRVALCAAKAIYARSGKPVFVTRSHQGCLVCGKDGVHDVPAIRVRGRVDTVGAGDSLLAGITVALAAGKSPEAAATFGALVAGVTVRKLHRTGTATPAEILRLGRTVS